LLFIPWVLTLFSCHEGRMRDMTFLSLGPRGSIIASINFLLAGLLVLATAGWSFVQRGCHSQFQREAKAFFQKIEEAEIRYKNVNNRYLLFDLKESDKALRNLKIDPGKAKYFGYGVEPMDNQGFRIIAYAKPEMLKKWYLHGPKAKFRLVYEKKEGEKGALLP